MLKKIQNKSITFEVQRLFFKVYLYLLYELCTWSALS